ncbi:winged helix-turn-helix transcriptional regulator [Paenibacillus pabuli]|uniref:winged helix-turn-helix transcriptional regulator n=1 Tax=Paenibacillus pabuli TaxID=1472 RepID=UPI0020003D08|nr:helix-turn-helix domain-containing protein [Paenibacillus pabuli]UPK42523.1 helix-turn-helix transcriptional regulator [Paenibacillus pabuli]
MTVYCKFGTALDILTGKWKSLILLRLLNNGTMRFSELQKAIPDISKKMLTQQLKELEYHDIVHREVYAQIPPKVEYSITEYGQLMKPVLQTMSDWGAGHVQHMQKLYGQEDGAETMPTDLWKSDSVR